MNSITLEGLVGSGELWLDIMRIICGDTSDKSMADLMCYKAPHTPQLGFCKRAYVDCQDRGLDFQEERKFFVQMDVMSYLFLLKRNVDVLICSDGIEHLYRSEVPEFIRRMKEKGAKVIIFTPLGPCNITRDTHPDAHKSGWYPADFEGWASIVLPNFHPTLNCGAFFAYHCSDEEKQRIFNEIKNKYVKS